MSRDTGEAGAAGAAVPTDGPTAVGQSSPAIGRRLDGWLDSHLTAVVLAILGVGLVLRVLVAALTYLGPSEALTLLSSIRPFAAAANARDFGSPQPLYRTFLCLWQGLGRADLLLRLPSLLAGAATVWFGFLWLRIVLGRFAGLFGATLLAFAPTLVRQSALVDGAAPLMLYVTAALFFLEQARARSSVRSMAWFGTLLVLAVASGLPGVWFALAVGTYVAFGAARRLPTRLAWVFLVSIATALALGAALYLPFALGAATRPGRGPEFFNFDQDGAWSFLVAQTLAVFNYVSASTEYGLVLLLAFLATAALMLLKRLAPDAAGVGSRELALLLLTPFVVSYTAAVAGITGYGHCPSSLYLAVFAVAGVSCLWARAAGRPIWLTLAAGLVIAAAWNAGPAGAAAALRDRRLSLMANALEYVREVVPPGSLILSDRPTRLLLEHYLSAGRTAPRSGDMAEFAEVAAGGYVLVSPGRLQLLSTDSLDRDLARLNDVRRLEGSSAICVVAVREGGNLADDLERITGVVYPGRRAFGRNVAVFFVPMPGDALGTLAERAAAFRTPVTAVFWPSGWFDDPAVGLLGDLADRVMPYSRLYRAVALRGGSAAYRFLPALAVWVFGTAERHPLSMRYMDDRENYYYADLRFTLLAADPETLAGLYLVESRVGMLLDSLYQATAGLPVGRCRAVLWPGPHFTDSTASRASRLADEVVSYSDLSRLTRDRPGIDNHLPALAFWVYQSPEQHPQFMAQMDEGKSYTSGQYRFTLLAADPDSIVSAWLIERAR